MTARRSGVRISVLVNVSLCVAVVAAGVATAALVNRDMRRQALAEAEGKARIVLDRNLATHTYFSQIMKPRLFEWTEGLRSPEYFEPSWMSSTYAIRRIDEYFQALNPAGYYVKDAAIDARSPDNEADEYERAFLRELNDDPTLQARSAVRVIDGQSYFAVLRRGETMEESCLGCHGDPADAPRDLVRDYGPERSFHRRVGEAVSAISLRVPLSAAYAQADRVSWKLSGLLALFLGALLAAQLWLHRRLLLAPVMAFRDKAVQIATDECHLGESVPVPFGREFGELAAAFNAMSASLRSGRDHLEQRVTERTAELASAAEGMKHEIAVRREAEEALRQARDFAESLVQTAQAIVLVLDREGRIVRYNSYMEQVSGYRLEEVRGADWFSIFLPERDRARARELFAHAVAGIRTHGNVNAIVTRDGRELQIEWYETTLRRADATPSGLLCVGVDVTDRRRLEEERRSIELHLHQARKLESLGVLAGGIAHDFNNLLMAILGNADAVSRQLSPDSPARRAVEAIREAGGRAAELTDQMLAYAGKAGLPVREIDLNTIVDEMGHPPDVATPGGARLEKRLARGLPGVRADAAQVRQVLKELVRNASEAVGEDAAGTILVETGVRECSDEYLRKSRVPGKCPAGRFVFLRVTDTGCGMEEEVMQNLFDPFYTTNFTGRGLGLAAVLGIVGAHGGAIMVKSEAGRGSTFTVLFPVSAGAQGGAAEPVRAERGG